LKVVSSIATRAAYLELVPAFEKASGHRVETQWVGMAHVRERIEAGEAVDAVIAAAAVLEELERGGRVGRRVDLVKSGVGVAVRSGARKPDIGSVDALKLALRAAKSIAYSSGPSGLYLAGLFRRLGIDRDLEGKAIQAPPGVLVGELVARGEAELCFQQVSELRQVPGIDYAGPLPPEIQLITVFSGAVPASAAQPGAGRALLEYLASPDVSPVMRRHGLEPA